MRNRFLTCIAFFLFAFSSIRAQPYTITGSVLDTVNNNPLQYASVSLLKAKDSVLQSFARANSDGNFSLRVNSAGNYLLMITFPGFADYVEHIELKDKDIALGVLPLISKTHLLKEFVLTQQYAAIKVKGDTIEYVADSFKVKDNATVEALLKKLPGLQVDKKGQITAQGEKVQKILVDGEEFFSDDPAVVTRGLQANAVDKVQVFDKKSEQAEFSGIDDGEKTKTINLQLKEDKKKGYFGKVAAGAGAGEERSYFENQAMFNVFKGKKQFSAFGVMSNTDQVGLGGEDREKYGANSNTNTVYEDGVMYSYMGDDEDNIADWEGNYTGQGLPKVWTGGLHYADKWKEEKHHLSANYRYSKNDIEIAGNTITQYILPGSQYHTTQDRNIFNSKQRHNADAVYDLKIDSTSSVKIKLDASYTTTHSSSSYNLQTFSENDSLINNSKRSVVSDMEARAVNSSLDWRKKFRKKGRTISLNLSERHRESESGGKLNSVNNYSTSTEYIDQHKQNDNTTTSYSSKLVYTEPVSKVATLELNYSLKADDAKALKYSYNKTNPASDIYDSLDAKYSSNYSFNILTHRGGSNVRFNFKKINFSFGGALSYADYKQKDLMHDTGFSYTYTNVNPSAGFKYTISQQSRLSLSYYGNTQQPTLEQMQPLRDNTDPLNVAIGNPYLKQEFDHSFNLSYNNFKRLSGEYTWVGIGTNFANNDISKTENIDGGGKRTYQYVNINGNYSVWYYANYGFKISRLKMGIGANINGNLGHVNNIVNGQYNTNNNNSYTFGLETYYNSDEEETIHLSIQPSITYGKTTTTINATTVGYFKGQVEFEAEFKLPKKIECGTDVNWYLRQKTVLFNQNSNVFIWNAYVSKKLLKNDQLVLTLLVSDILNQNIGFNRTSQNNSIVQDSYNTVRRYGLLRLTWNFTKTPLQLENADKK